MYYSRTYVKIHKAIQAEAGFKVNIASALVLLVGFHTASMPGLMFAVVETSMRGPGQRSEGYVSVGALRKGLQTNSEISAA
ncbi:hypothetical protein AOLI_G00044890 [Acnodon oligacanthus]